MMFFKQKWGRVTHCRTVNYNVVIVPGGRTLSGQDSGKRLSFWRVMPRKPPTICVLTICF